MKENRGLYLKEHTTDLREDLCYPWVEIIIGIFGGKGVFNVDLFSTELIIFAVFN